MNSQSQAPDFASLVQALFESQAKSDRLINESKELTKKMGRARHSLEKLGDAMSEDNVVDACTKASQKRRKAKKV